MERKKGDINKRKQKLEGELKSTGQKSAEMSEMKVEEVMGGYQGREEGERRTDEILSRRRSGGVKITERFRDV